MPNPTDDPTAPSPEEAPASDPAASDTTAAGDQDALAPPPSFGRQMAQLVIIPAMIVIACISVAVLFGLLAGRKQNIETYLDTIQSTSGLVSGGFDANLPRVQERGRAAYNIATMIPSIDDPARRREISERLITILDNHVHPAEAQLQQYLLIAVGQLGQDGGLTVIRDRLADDQSEIVRGAIHALLAWPDKTAAGVLTPQVAAAMTRTDDPLAQTAAAAALGELARPGDDQVIAALRQVMGIIGQASREARWNAAIALARLGDEQGANFVTDVLLSREALAAMPAAELSRDPDATMPRAAQDRVLISTLAAVATMTNERIGAKIKGLAAEDDSAAVRAAAQKVLQAGASPAQREPGDDEAGEG